MAAEAKAPLQPLGLRVRPGSPFIACVVLKRHEPAASAASAQDNAVFVAGLPLGVDEEALTAMFSCFGAVAQAVMHPTQARASACVGGWGRRRRHLPLCTARRAARSGRRPPPPRRLCPCPRSRRC